MLSMAYIRNAAIRRLTPRDIDARAKTRAGEASAPPGKRTIGSPVFDNN
jgi:hypothetical protein